MENVAKIVNLEQDFFVHHRIISAFKRVEVVSDRMSYTVLRGRWCNIIARNVNASSEEQVIIKKEELELVFYHFPKYHVKILFGDCNTKLERDRERERERGGIFSNRQLGMRVYIRIVMIMVSE
jgi:hypothetical protein